MKVVAPLKNNEKNPPLLSTMLIKRFEGSCGTFGEGEKNPLISRNFSSRIIVLC